MKMKERRVKCWSYEICIAVSNLFLAEDDGVAVTDDSFWWRSKQNMLDDVRSRNFQIAETTTRRLWVFNITLRPSEVVTRSVKFKHNLTSGAEMSSIPPFWADVYSRNLRDKENGLRLWTCTFPTQLPSFAPTWKKYQNISLESALIFQTVL